MNLLRRFALLSPLLCLGSVLWGQGSGIINGTVTDPSGAAIPEAKVTVIEVGTKFSRYTVASQDGYYVLNSLRPTEYVITVEQAGFEKFSQTGVTLLANQSLTVNPRLSLNVASETVTVSEGVTQVDTTTATLKQVVESSRMVEIPLNGRNAAQLTTLVAGAVTAPSNNADQGAGKTFPAAVTVSTNGSRENQVGYQLDGVPNVDIFSNVNQPFPFPDALQEFSVQTSNYNAEYGQNAGGVVSIVTKSGTNQFHGDAFGFLRNAVFNARNYFAPVRDPLKRGQFGGTFGGPVIRDRTFFFFGYQGTRIRSTQNASHVFVPTIANLNGDFSSFLSASDPNNPLHRAVTVIDPLNKQPFAGNQVPTSRFDPASVAFTKYLPRVGADGGVFFSLPIRQDFDEYIVRGDHSFSQNDRLSARFNSNVYDGADSYGGNLIAYKDGSTITSKNAVVQEMHTFTPNILNDFRVGFARTVSNRRPPTGTPTAGDFGVNIFQPSIPTIQGISITGFFSIGDQPTAKFPRTSFSWTDDVHWVRGRHSFAFGGFVERDRLNMVNTLGIPGTFNFSGDATGLALADLMLGKLRTFGQAWGQHVKNRYLMINFYAQDSFHIMRRLTLSYGLRIEPSQVWHDLYRQNEVFYKDLFAKGVHSSVFPNAPAGLLFSGDKEVPEYGARSDLNNIAPRVGFAYDVFGNGRTSIRGGGGVFYDSRAPALANNRQLGAAPYASSVSLTTPAGPFSNPYQGIVNPFPAQFPPASNVTFTSPVQVYSWDPGNKFVTPANYSWNLAVEQALTQNWLTRFAYVGSRANHLTVSLEDNPAVYIPGSSASTDARRLYPGFSNIYQASNAGNSWYHSFQATLQRRFAKGLTLNVNYTFSKSTDNLPLGTDAATFGTGGFYTLPIYLQNFQQDDRGRSDFDRRHVFVASYVWALPTLSHMNRMVRTVAGGWELTGVVSAQSGGPLTIYVGKDASLSGIGKDRAQIVSSQVYSAANCASSAPPCVSFLNSAAFASPVPGAFGNAGKGALSGPGFVNSDAGFFKFFPINERYRLQFRGEFFNSLNHARFSNPVTSINTAGFGNILSASDPRILQLALKVFF